MQGVLDILQAVATRGPLSFDTLETFLHRRDGRDGQEEGFGYFLDVCVDGGLLRRTWARGTRLDADRYRVTRAGQAFLLARGAMAA